MRLPIYHVDAFTQTPFRGNPAAVCPLPAWLDDKRMQAVAGENNLSETAFFVPDGDRYALRWFTPTMEVDLCGHATLASAFVVFTHLDPTRERVAFDTRSGPLTVEREGERLWMDFPATPAVPCACPESLRRGLGLVPEQVLRTADYVAVVESEDAIRALRPNLTELGRLDLRGVCVTAPGSDADFVSRFFAPRAGIPEDPVTGSSHCALTPYWAVRTGKTTLFARQLSARGGELWCELMDARVRIGGYVAPYLEGVIEV